LVRTSRSVTWGWLVTSLPSCLRVSGIAPQSVIIFVRVPAIVMILVLWTETFFVWLIHGPHLTFFTTFGLFIYGAFLFELHQFWVIFSFAIVTWGWLVTSLPSCLRVSGIAPQSVIIFVRVPAIVMILVLWTETFFVRLILRPLLTLLSTYGELKLRVFTLPF